MTTFQNGFTSYVVIHSLKWFQVKSYPVTCRYSSTIRQPQNVIYRFITTLLPPNTKFIFPWRYSTQYQVVTIEDEPLRKGVRKILLLDPETWYLQKLWVQLGSLILTNEKFHIRKSFLS